MKLPPILIKRENSNPSEESLKIKRRTEDDNLNVEYDKENPNLEENKFLEEGVWGDDNEDCQENAISPMQTDPSSQREDDSGRKLESPDTYRGLSDMSHPLPYKVNTNSPQSIDTNLNNESRKITRGIDTPVHDSQLPSLPQKTDRKSMFQAHKEKKKSKAKACKGFCIGLMATIYVHYITIYLYIIYNIYRCYTHLSTYFSYWQMNRFI